MLVLKGGHMLDAFRKGGFHFCGRSKITGLPYCDFHARRAFQPPQPRRRDREVLVPALPAAAPAGSEVPEAKEKAAV